MARDRRDEQPPLHQEKPPAMGPLGNDDIKGPVAREQPPIGALAPPQANQETPKQPENTTRACPYHKLLLRANKTEALFTRYYCPEEGCTYSEKVPRKSIRQQSEQAQNDQENFSAR